jgi:hypothetical protein
MRLAAFLCAVSFASVVHAQTVAPTAPQKPTKPMIDAAERYFRDGVRFTEEGNYDAARVSFEAGYKLSGEPDFSAQFVLDGGATRAACRRHRLRAAVFSRKARR